MKLSQTQNIIISFSKLKVVINLKNNKNSFEVFSNIFYIGIKMRQIDSFPLQCTVKNHQLE